MALLSPDPQMTFFLGFNCMVSLGLLCFPQWGGKDKNCLCPEEMGPVKGEQHSSEQRKLFEAFKMMSLSLLP